MSTNDCIQLGLLITSAIAIVFSIYSYIKQIKILNVHLKLSFFSDYTKRYQEILVNLPHNINHSQFDFNNLTNSERDKTMNYLRVYFNLCSEEYDLYLKNHIPEDVWIRWEKGMKHSLSKPSYVYAWQLIKTETYYDEAFINYFDKALIQIQAETIVGKD